ncbi:MAG: hypothetical protein H6746_02115 [Deltaproteobacteria bacterium]|nr:hypothetical protein [Deltaproteobacteria bacterium]
MRWLHRLTALSFILLYLAIAFHLEDAVFPTRRFDMFSQPWGHSYGLQLVRLPGGEVVHPTSLDRWDCPTDPATVTPPGPGTPNDPCAGFHVNTGTERTVLEWVRSHPAGEGPPLVPVEFFRRVYRFPEGGGAPTTVDCPIMTCRAGTRTP